MKIWKISIIVINAFLPVIEILVAEAHTTPAQESGVSFGIATNVTPVPYYGIKSAFTTVKDGVELNVLAEISMNVKLG